MCERRVNHPRQGKTPESSTLAFRLPAERKETLHEGLKALADVTGATKAKYPLGTLVEALLLLGGENRERLTALFNGMEEGL
jgi:hypothetical protein